MWNKLKLLFKFDFLSEHELFHCFSPFLIWIFVSEYKSNFALFINTFLSTFLMFETLLLNLLLLYYFWGKMV